MKYRIVGILNLFFGFIGFILQLAILFFVYPKLNSIYTSYNVQVPFVTKYFPYLITIFLIFFIFTMLIGLKLIRTSSNKTILKIGVFSLGVVLFFSVSYIVLSSMSIVFPLASFSKM
ncbi:MAG TPA: hypothetical protein VLI92_02060 [Candidatus Saccharimonadales bacterium]|nr:hypothetical protein [Candidatus Saccharimonadales bacterium]